MGFFKKEESWEEHWQDMPEFKQEDLMPYNEIVIKFRNQKDMEKFMDIIDQKFNEKTKSIWYPKLNFAEISKLRWLSIK